MLPAEASTVSPPYSAQRWPTSETAGVEKTDELCIKEAEGESGENTLRNNGQSEELKDISCSTSPAVVAYSLFLVLLIVLDK